MHRIVACLAPILSLMSAIAVAAPAGLYGLGASGEDIGASTIYSMNPVTGAATVYRTLASGQGAEAIEYIPSLNRAMMYLVGPMLYSVDLDSGSVTPVGSDGLTFGMFGLAYDGAHDTLFGIQTLGGDLYQIDMNSGAVTRRGSTGVSTTNGWTGLAFDSSTGTLYATNVVNDALYRINPSNGAAAFVGFTGFEGLDGLTYDPSRDELFASNVSIDAKKLVSLNRTTGAGTAIGDMGIGNQHGVYGLTYVPEPSTALLVAAVAGVLILSRHRLERTQA